LRAGICFKTVEPGWLGQSEACARLIFWGFPSVRSQPPGALPGFDTGSRGYAGRGDTTI